MSQHRRAGRPRVYDQTFYTALQQYVEGLQKQTGLSLNAVCKHGKFGQSLSGSSMLDGPDRPTLHHEVKGSRLRRLYFEGVALLGRRVDSSGQGQTDPGWAIGWVKLTR
jgi:hypothetical protein